MNDYAALLGTMKQYAEAETLQREAIAIGRQVLGADTLTVANLTNNLAVTLTSLGRLADAERAFREAFDQHVSLLGEHHWRVRNIARNIGRILSLQQQYDEALPWMDRADRDRRRPRRQSEDPGLEGMRAQRAWILFRLGRRAEALEAVTAAVSALEHMKDPNDGYALAFSRVLLARILVEMGRPGPGRSSSYARRWRGSNGGAATIPVTPMRNASWDARGCFRARSPREGPRSSGACRFIAPGVRPTAKSSSRSSDCSLSSK